MSSPISSKNRRGPATGLSNESLRESLLLLTTALLAHGLLLLNDGVYWDAWLYHPVLGTGSWDAVYTPFLRAGLPIEGSTIWLVGRLGPDTFVFKLVAFATVVLSAFAIKSIGNRLGVTTREENLCLALLTLLYPNVDMMVGFPHVSRWVDYAIFLGAARLALSVEGLVGTRHFVLRPVVLLLFFVSFNNNALLVFYFGFLWLLFVSVGHDRGPTSRLPSPFRFLTRHLDYVVLPFAFWLVKEAFFPRHGEYAGYNRFVDTPIPLLKALYYFLANAVYGQMNEALLQVAHYPLVALAAGLIALGAYDRFNLGSQRFFGDRSCSTRFLLFGVVLLGMAIFPYIVVGLWPDLSGWSSRHAMMVGLPLAMLVMWATCSVFLNSARSLSRSGFVALVVLMVGLGLVNIRNHMGWEARWVKDRSIMAHLAQIHRPANLSVIRVDDRYPIGSNDYYRFYEWTGMFREVWGDQRVIGLDLRVSSTELLPEDSSLSSERYLLKDFNPKGCQSVMTIRRGPIEYSEWDLVLRYFFYRFMNPGGMTSFLSRVTDVQLKPLEAPQAEPCEKISDSPH
ncbi:MAG: hypothetical protein HY914_00430 [Desulfomonile tiedjei]|nr:hypothetical protein [Desulfomonile tiedjei]